MRWVALIQTGFTAVQTSRLSGYWVSIDRVCDNVKDCVSGAEECGTCDLGALSSAKFLIQSQVVLAFTSIMGILIIVMKL